MRPELIPELLRRTAGQLLTGLLVLAGLRSESHSEDGAPEEERYTRVWLRPSAEPPVLALSDLLPRRRAGVVRYATQSGKGAL